MKEQIVVTMTSWRKRIGNIPAVLDTIWAQTRKPDVVVINLAEEEFKDRKLPDDVQAYIDAHPKIRINWVEKDTKVWKKLLPALRLYPDALFLTIDDDILYPKTMITDFMRAHKKNPDAPISGNKYRFNGVKAHCGCASLVQGKHFVTWTSFYNHKFRLSCPASDIFYTLLAAANGYFYEETNVDYQKTAVHYNDNDSYTKSLPKSRLTDSAEAFYNKKHYTVSKLFTDEDKKPYAVLCSVQNTEGKKIEEEQLEWLTKNYNVYVVRHDGSLFEFPGLRFLQMMTIRTGKPMLYIHTRGAFHRWKTTLPTRRMWEHEFGSEQQKYFDLVNTDEPTVACPFSGQSKYTLYNGFVANAAAMAAIPTIEQSADRFIYEKIFEGSNVNVIGTIINIPDDEESKNAARQFLYTNYK